MSASRGSGWFSPSVGREMPVVRHGHAGAPVVYVPTSGGDEREFERYAMPELCEPWLRQGRLQVFSIDGCGPTTLFDDRLAPAERIRAYARFERYAAEELLPWVSSETGRDDPVLVGASYGGTVVANLWAKHAERVGAVCGLGGVYGLWHRLEGHHDDDVYFHTPLEYLPRLQDRDVLDGLRATRGLTLYAAEQDPWLESTLRLARVLRDKELPHRLEVWPAPADHHEHWWRLQLRSFLESRRW